MDNKPVSVLLVGACRAEMTDGVGPNDAGQTQRIKHMSAFDVCSSLFTSPMTHDRKRVLDVPVIQSRAGTSHILDVFRTSLYPLSLAGIFAATFVQTSFLHPHSSE